MIAQHPSPFPYWLYKEIPIDISLTKKIDKKTTSPVVMKSLTESHLGEFYQSYNKIFTDASKLESKVGIGVYEEKSKKRYALRIDDNVSITTGELVAIKKVFENIIEQPYPVNTQICICTDSLGACQAICSGDVKYVARPDILNDIYNLYEDIQKLEPSISIQIVWIPSHIDITGNDIADDCANEGRSRERVDYVCKLGYSELVSMINNGVNERISDTV